MSRNSWGDDIPFDQLLGKTLKSVTGKVGDDEIVFETESGQVFKLFHRADCCECVEVNDICGDLQDLIGSPILQAEENSNGDDIPGQVVDDESWTWTFYRIATMKGQVVIRWLGSSNGYYSEDVSFVEIEGGAR